MEHRIIVDDELISCYYEEYFAIKSKYEAFNQKFDLTFNQFLNGKIAMLKAEGVNGFGKQKAWF